jgi:hypothetical protein
MNGLDAMLAILAEFSRSANHHTDDLTTFAGEVEGTMNRGAKAFLLKAQLDKELLGTIRTATAGIKRLAKQDLSLSGRCAHRDGSWITPDPEVDGMPGELDHASYSSCRVGLEELWAASFREIDISQSLSAFHNEN